ncbi:MAG: hypothetical protein EXR07_06395 [Acetobacteraceae bacterium]|nr:hypothetical protein [Acetobacteraceae bacterium]
MARLIVPLCLVLLGACADRHSIGPEAWWHDAIGGKIAAERPPPPGDKDPYPNLATVPARPSAPDAAAMNRMTAGLIADRIAASHAAALAPIPPPTSPTAAIAPSPAPAAATASLVGTGPSAPPAPKAAQPVPVAAPPPGPAQAPSASTATAAAQGTATAAPGTAPAAPGTVTTAQATAPAASGPLPPLPTREPQRARIAPPPPKIIPISATPPPETPLPTDGAPVDFDPRSASLNEAALARIKVIASSRGELGIGVTGHGDAGASDPLTQSEALDLALRRAQALATALVAQGVPNAFLRVNAEAAGRGANLRLLQ